MEYKILAETGLKVSEICLGTLMFGSKANEAESFEIMDYAVDCGINFFDTANAYNAGESERIIGKWLKDKRDQIILATKVGNKMGANPLDSGLSRRNIVASCDASLKRLNTDYIDIYYIHHRDPNTSLEETMEAMSGLIKAGKVRYTGISNHAAWQIADALALCDKRGYVPPVITECVYNMITRGIESELVPFLSEHKIGLAIYNPIAGGLLAGKYKAGQSRENTRFADKNYYDRYWSDENFVALGKLSALAAANGMSILQLAMRWCVGQKCVTSTITGVSSLSQLQQNIAAAEGEPLSDDICARCDEIWDELSGHRFQYIR